MPAGRPRHYDDVEELAQMCESYFEQLPRDDEGKRKPPTVNGLSLYLGFSDKSTLYDYRDHEKFSHPIKKSLTRIEQSHEEGLSSGKAAGHIFALKNSGWTDKQEISHHVTPPINLWADDEDQS